MQCLHHAPKKRHPIISPVYTQYGHIYPANEKTSSVTQLYVEFGITYTTTWVGFGMQVAKTCK